MRTRRKHSREFKVQAVKLVRERGRWHGRASSGLEWRRQATALDQGRSENRLSTGRSCAVCGVCKLLSYVSLYQRVRPPY